MVDLWGGVVAVYENVAEGISTAWDATVGAFSAVGQWIQEKWNGAVETISGVFSGLGEWFRNAWGNITGVFDTVGGWFRSAWEGAIGIFSTVGGWLRSAWDGVISVFNGIGEFFKRTWYGFLKALNGIIKYIPGVDYIDIPKEYAANGGIIGGDSYQGDKIITGINSGEMVINRNQQSNLFGFISNIPSILSSMLVNKNDVKAKPVGEKEYIYTPNSNSNNGVTELTVRDININVNGTIKLDAGNFAKNIDINQLLNDSSFVSSLKEIIKSSINNDMNGGRFMNDNATLRGSLGTTTYWGR